ncbi:MAG TPA: response regulator [Bryobacteraceae bacterium]|nr:response regulator [Bryobacteraceae bacterium]
MAAILVVEDDLDQLSMRRQLLEDAGYEVRTAQSAAAALPQLRGCHAVLMDLRIPQVDDGVKLILAATELSARIIVLSGARSERALPVDEFLVKPCSSKKVLETVARFCAGQPGA